MITGDLRINSPVLAWLTSHLGGDKSTYTYVFSQPHYVDDPKIKQWPTWDYLKREADHVDDLYFTHGLPFVKEHVALITKGGYILMYNLSLSAYIPFTTTHRLQS